MGRFRSISATFSVAKLLEGRFKKSSNAMIFMKTVDILNIHPVIELGIPMDPLALRVN